MFSLLNLKWGEPTFGTPGGTVTWSSELDDVLPLGDGATNASIDATLNLALQAWQDVSAINFVEDTGGGGQINFSAAAFDATFTDMPELDGAVGVAIVRPDLAGLNTITDVDVVFNTDLDFPWSDVGGPASFNFLAVAMHEIGHAIGLDHPSDPNQIMSALVIEDELQLGDIQGAQYLYGTDGGDVEVEAGEPEAVRGEGTSESGGGGGGGILIALLALLAGIFTGGSSVAALAAAGGLNRPSDDDDDDAPQFEGHEGHSHAGGHCGHIETEDGSIIHGAFFAEEMMLPMIDFTTRPNPCGCIGLCEHILNENEDPVEDEFV